MENALPDLNIDPAAAIVAPEIAEVVGENAPVQQNAMLFPVGQVNGSVNQDGLLLPQDNNNNLPALGEHMNLSVNLAFISPFNNGDPGFQNLRADFGKASPDLYRPWAKFFSPVGCPELSVQIPKDWASLFLTMLLSPDSFYWARKFLCSPIWKVLLSCTNTSSFMTFALPATCPDRAKVIYQSTEGSTEKLPEVVGENLYELSKEKSSTKSLEPLVETQVRRSPRIKTRNGGFKGANCSAKGCLTCSSCPPGLSISMIQAIGEDACKIAPRTLTEASLLAKKKSDRVVGGDKAHKKPSSEKNEVATLKKKKKLESTSDESTKNNDDNNRKKKKH